MNVKKKKSIMKFIRGHIYIYQYIEKVLITVQSLWEYLQVRGIYITR